MSRYRERGYETQIVHSEMITCLFANSRRIGFFGRVGNIERTTCGMVSPMIMPKAHMPPKAKANWKKDTAARPLGPKQWSMMSMYVRLPLSLALMTIRRIVQSVTPQRMMSSKRPVTNPA